MFLRGFFCDFAARAGIPVTMASSTPDGDRRALVMNASQGRFVLAFRGVGGDGNVTDTWRTVETVERVIPSTDWPQTLALARNPDYSLVVSNVSEAGFRRAEPSTDDVLEQPVSFPARLTRWLYERWQTLGDTATVTILPCELFTENGRKLRQMLDAVSDEWHLPEGFRIYLADTVTIADTLVDRIVTGEPSPQERDTLWRERLGGESGLPIIVAEPFALWAIQGDPALQKRLASLCQSGNGAVVVTPDISPFVLKKVRFLNGLHSAMAAVGTVEFGVTMVREAIEHPELGPLLISALYEEILPAMVPPLGEADARAYADAIWDRFTNPFLQHRLADINKGATAKWPVRLLPTIKTYQERFGKEPPVLGRCLRAFDRMNQG